MWTLFPMNPVMRRLGWGVFLLLWPLNLGDGQWMTLVTGLAGSFLLLLALWRLRDADGYFRRAFFWLLPVLLLQAGGLAASYYLEADEQIWFTAASCLCTAALLVQITRGLSSWLPPGSRLRPRTAAAWYLLGTAVGLYLLMAAGGSAFQSPLLFLLPAPYLIAGLKVVRAAQAAYIPLPYPERRGSWAVGLVFLAMFGGMVGSAMAVKTTIPSAALPVAADDQAGRAALTAVGMPSEVAADLSAEEAARFAGIRGIQAKTAEQDCDGGRVRLTLAAGYATDGELRVVAHYHWLQAPRHQAQDAVGLAYSAALLTETGEELVSQRHLIDQGGKTRQLKNAAHPLGRNAAGTVIPAGRGTQRRGYLAKSFRLNSREPTTVSLYVQLVHQSRFVNLPYQPPLSLCAPHGASSGPEGPFDQLFTDLPISYEPEGYTPPEVNV